MNFYSLENSKNTLRYHSNPLNFVDFRNFSNRFHFSNTACKLLKTVKTLVIEERFCSEKKKGFSLKYYFLDRSPQSDKQDGADRLHRILTISIDHPAISRRSRRTNPRSARRRDFSRRSVTCKCRGRLAKSTSESGSLVNEKTRDLWCTWSLNTSLVFLEKKGSEIWHKQKCWHWKCQFEKILQRK